MSFKMPEVGPDGRYPSGLTEEQLQEAIRRGPPSRKLKANYKPPPPPKPKAKLPKVSTEMAEKLVLQSVEELARRQWEEAAETNRKYLGAKKTRAMKEFYNPDPREQYSRQLGFWVELQEAAEAHASEMRSLDHPFAKMLEEYE